MIKFVQYFVEGECEEKLINSLKTPPCNYYISGKVVVFNVIQKILSKQRILSIKNNALIILVYDTDVKDDSKLNMNIKLLKENGFNKIIHLQSIQNFEDEIRFATSLKSLNQIFNTHSEDEFKTKFIHANNVLKTLDENNFKKEKIWSRKSVDKMFNKYDANNLTNIIKK